MPFSAKDIDDLQLKSAFRGYDTDEVDDLLDRIAAQIHRTDRELADLRARLDEAHEDLVAARAASDGLRSEIDALQKRAAMADSELARQRDEILQATERAEQSRQQARDDAEVRISSIEADAQRRIDEAQARADDAEVRVSAVEADAQRRVDEAQVRADDAERQQALLQQQLRDRADEVANAQAHVGELEARLAAEEARAADAQRQASLADAAADQARAVTMDLQRDLEQLREAARSAEMKAEEAEQRAVEAQASAAERRAQAAVREWVPSLGRTAGDVERDVDDLLDQGSAGDDEDDPLALAAQARGLDSDDGAAVREIDGRVVRIYPRVPPGRH